MHSTYKTDGNVCFERKRDTARTLPLHPFPTHLMAQQNADTEAEHWVEIVKQKVASVRFGSVQIIVHEGRVTQVESTEKTRLAGEPPVNAQPRK